MPSRLGEVKAKANFGQISATSWNFDGDSDRVYVSHMLEKAMTIIETIEKRTSALKVGEMAKLLGVTPQHIYKLASCGRIPHFRVAGAIRLDPAEVAAWLKNTQPKRARSAKPRAA